jgi:hypothetical protein
VGWAGRRPRPSGEGGLGLGEGGSPREEEEGVGRLKAKAHSAGQKTEMGPTSKRNSFRISIDFKI